MKKLFRPIPLCLIAIVIFGLLSVGTSWYALDHAKAAIADLPETIELNDETRSKLDQAQLYVNELDTGIGVSTFFADDVDAYINLPVLQQAKADYATMAINQAYTTIMTTQTLSDELKSQIDEARAVLEDYFPDQDYSLIPNYEILPQLEALYPDSDS